MIDPYEILGVGHNATVAQLKKAFHRLARECHPDSDPDNPWAEDEFKALSAAYELLSDSKRRAPYMTGAKSAATEPSVHPGRRRRERQMPRPETSDTINLPNPPGRLRPRANAPRPPGLI